MFRAQTLRHMGAEHWEDCTRAGEEEDVGPYVSLPAGFSITELQRKQAMLNASKQQATGKPKGKWTVVPPVGSSVIDYISDPQKQSHQETGGSQRCPLPFAGIMFPKTGDKRPQVTKLGSVHCSLS